MSKTATIREDGTYGLSEPMAPFSDGLCFSAVVIREASPEVGLLVLGVSEDGREHPAPLLPPGQESSPAAALAALGYTLA
ncbi:hypothetical protein [Xanthobacter aminoxidans]|uniref:Uncharacterized protein n=1 Tax=Xanthobacter aminoxidans TaxID=186280 RepID=A0ABW6ZAH0_9HYPH